MPTRITIILKDDLMNKLRNIQASEIKKSQKSVSLSKIINDMVNHCSKEKSTFRIGE